MFLTGREREMGVEGYMEKLRENIHTHTHRSKDMRLTGKGKDKKNTAEVKREKRTESRKETNIMREEDRERCGEWEKKKL